MLLDVAGGTGDIARRFLERAGDDRAMPSSATSPRACCAAGATAPSTAGCVTGIDWLCGDAERLPIADASVDAYTIAFGLRNVTHIDAALAEARRVLKPGGRFFCLEFSRVEPRLLRPLYDLYSFTVLPRARRRSSPATARPISISSRASAAFRRSASWPAMMEDAGLEQVRFRNLTGGIAALHSGWRL